MNKEQKRHYKETFIKYLYENRPSLSDEEFETQVLNQNEWNSGKNIYPADFSYKDLTGRSFKDMDLQDAVFIGAIIDKCDFTGATLNNAKFTTFSHAKLEKIGINAEEVITYEKYLAALEKTPNISLISDSEIEEQLMIHEDPRNPDIADFSYKDLTGKSFKNMNLSCANFKGSILVNCDFTGSSLDGANFSHLTKPELQELGLNDKGIYSYEHMITDDYLDKDYMMIINALDNLNDKEEKRVSIITSIEKPVIDLIKQAKTMEELDLIALEIIDLLPIDDEDKTADWEDIESKLMSYYKAQNNIEQYYLVCEIADELLEKRHDLDVYSIAPILKYQNETKENKLSELEEKAEKNSVRKTRMR